MKKNIKKYMSEDLKDKQKNDLASLAKDIDKLFEHLGKDLKKYVGDNYFIRKVTSYIIDSIDDLAEELKYKPPKWFCPCD